MSDKVSESSVDPDHQRHPSNLDLHPDRFLAPSSPAPPPPLSNTDYRHARWPIFRTELDEADEHSAPPSPSLASSGTQRVPAPQSSVLARDAGRIVVVGVCSSGKSTLVNKLREKGYDAHTVAQEHSYISDLWRRSRPDVLVYLDASIHTIRRRRRARWPQQMLDEEHRRLSLAREQCDLYIPTDGLLPEDVASRVITFLNNQGVRDWRLGVGGALAEDQGR